MLPIVATLLAQGLGILGNAVIQKGQAVIEEKLGVKLETAVQTPEGLLNLKQLEIDHEEFLINAAMENRKIDLEEFREEVKDRSSARQMQETALLQADVMAKQFIYWFSWFWSVATFAYIAAITFFQIPEANVRFADTVLGFLLGTIVAGIMSYFYGSTVNNRGKDRTIDKLVNEVAK